MDIITAWYDWEPQSINGKFTLQSRDKTLFFQLPARSGQPGYSDKHWIAGKSPIPRGTHKLWLHPKNPDSWPTAPGGIGEFFPISSSTANSRIIQGVEPTQRRVDIGLHPENSYPGSAGCIVLLNDTVERKAYVAALFEFLRRIGANRQTIDLRVL